MSRTKKGSKGPGCEFWSKRPTSFRYDTGKVGKKITHKLERIEGKKQTKDY